MSTKINILPILFVNFMSTLSFSIVLPFLIILVLDFGGNAVIYGLLGATYSFFQFIGTPNIGKWSDTVGKKKMLLLTHGGTLIAWIIFLIAMSVDKVVLSEINNNVLGVFVFTLPLLLLFASRILDGITGGNISVAYAYIANISEEERASNFGKMGVSSNIGFVFGPVLSGVLGSINLLYPVYAAIFISFAGLLLILFALEPIQDMDKGSVVKQEKKQSLKGILKLKHIPILLVINFIFYLGFNFFYVAFPVFAVSDNVGWSLTDLGYFYALLGLSMAIVQGPGLKFMSKKLSQGPMILLGNFILIWGFGLFSLGVPWVFYLGGILIAIGNGLAFPSLLTIIANHVDNEIQGYVQGIAASSGSLASIIGLLVGGLLYDTFLNTIFIFSGGLFVILVILSITLINKEIEHDGKVIHYPILHRFLSNDRQHHIHLISKHED